MNDPTKYAFASDNCAGMCPEALESLQQANADYAPSYGADRWTLRAIELIKDFFECDCEVHFLFNGTAANSLAIASMCQSYQSVIAHRYSHIQTDECGCPEFITGGTKILLVDGEQGLVDVDQVDAIASYRRDVHFPAAKVLDVTQATEFGTVYDREYLGRLGQVVSRRNLRWHMDGARFANAVASLDCSPKEITWQVGVDCLTLGGTKNGMAVGECLVFFNRELAAEFGSRMKQAGQLASKMRYLSAPWVGVLESGAFLKHARHANASAKSLAEQLSCIEGIEIARQPQANAVFAKLSPAIWQALEAENWHFYDLFGTGEARLMCSWVTTESEIENFLAAILNTPSASETLSTELG